MLCGDLISDPRLPGIEGEAAIDPSFAPPALEIDQLVRLLRNGEQRLPSFLIAVLAPQPLNAVVEQTDVAIGGACGNCIQELTGIGPTLDHGDARRDLFLLGWGQ